MALGRLTVMGQGVYYLLTGLWPLVSMRTFELITGPKVDRWLVRMVGLLAAAIGLTLFRAARARRITPDIGLLAAGSALSFWIIDVVYVARGRISPVYLLDAAAELLLMALLATAWWHARRATSEERDGRGPPA